MAATKKPSARKKRQPKPKPEIETRGRPRFTKYSELEATLAAMRSIAAAKSDLEIVAELKAHWSIQDGYAQRIVQVAYERIWQAQDPRTLREKFVLAETQTLELYRQCLEEGDRATALQSLRHLHKLQGLLKQADERRDDPIETAGESADEFGNRSVEDLEFFQRHGCFPEDFKAETETPRMKDPLALLEAPSNGKAVH